MKKNRLSIRLMHKLIARYYLKKPEIEPLLNQKYYSWRAIFYELMNTAYYLAKSDKTYTVTSVAFEPSNTCNLKCMQCPVNHGMKRKKGYMEFELFKKVIDENPKLLFIMPFLWGEPLLHPRIYDMIEYSSKRGIPVHISTNAALLDSVQKIDRLLKSGVSALQISLDGTGDTYTKVRGVEYKKIKKTIELILKRRKALHKENALTVNLNIVIFEQTEEAVNKVKKEWEHKVDYIQLSPRLVLRPTPRKKPCFELWRGNIVILWDGKCVPCWVDYEGTMAYGNAYNNTLKEILNSDQMRKRRREQMSKNFKGICGKCGEYNTSLVNKRLQ